jgi:glutathione peroxidase
MKIYLTLISVSAMLLVLSACGSNRNESAALTNESKTGDVKMNNNISDIAVKDMEDNEINLSAYKGKVLLIVNVASECGYTPQYEGLQKIYEEYKDKGFEILAFPCNQFGGQEPGTNKEIKEFCSINYGVTFKLFDKIDVNGTNRSPLYERLTNNTMTESGDVKWNFEKFLIAKNGDIVKRFRSKVKPESEELIQAIEKEIMHEL